jgi:hypothetical protein
MDLIPASWRRRDATAPVSAPNVDEPGRDEAALRNLLDKPAGRRLLSRLERENEAEILAQRRDTRRQADALKAELAIVGLQKARELEECRALVPALQQQLRDAEAAVSQAHGEYLSATASIEHRLGRLERLLIESASPLIAAAEHQLIAWFDALAAAQMTHETVEERTGKRIVATNTDSIASRGMAIRAARQALAALRLEVLDGDELKVRVDALLVGIPQIDGVAAFEVHVPAIA